jgi:hypothetical protein
VEDLQLFHLGRRQVHRRGVVLGEGPANKARRK